MKPAEGRTMDELLETIEAVDRLLGCPFGEFVAAVWNTPALHSLVSFRRR